MLKLKQTKRETIEITTPAGVVSLHLFGDGFVGIDAPKAWPVRRIDLPQATANGGDPLQRTGNSAPPVASKPEGFGA